MADVFISYSKSHRHLTADLARELEAKGLDVWWDTDLLAGESFRQRIQAELKACKAAIVIWTPDSVNSDYVLSEAERARIAKKLIQVRTYDIEPTDLPTPFDTSHVPLISDRRSIFGGLARLGVLKDYAVDPATPTALYVGAGRGMSWFSGRRGIAIGLLTLALVVGVVTALSITRSGIADLGSDTLKSRATSAAEAFHASLNSGLKDTSFFASEVRLGRRGLMSKVDAIGELRKLEGKYSRISCKPESGSLTVKKAEQAPDGFRAIMTSYCDLTDKGGQNSTEKFALEIEAARSGGKDLISGLWQPEKMVLWQPR